MKIRDWVKKNDSNTKPAYSFNSDCVVWKDIKFIYEQYVPNWKKYVRMYTGIDDYISQNHLTDFELLPRKFCAAINPSPFCDVKNLPILKVSVNILFIGIPAIGP